MNSIIEIILGRVPRENEIDNITVVDEVYQKIIEFLGSESDKENCSQHIRDNFYHFFDDIKTKMKICYYDDFDETIARYFYDFIDKSLFKKMRNVIKT